MNAKEYYEKKYPLHTRLLKRWIIDLMESYHQSKSKEEAGEISIKLQYVMRDIEYATQYGGMSERKLKMLWNNFVADIDKLAAFGKDGE